MKKALKLLAIAALLAIGVWLYHVLFPSDERLIRKLLTEAAETATITPNENALVKLAGANKLAGLFSRDAVLRLNVEGLNDRTISGHDDLLQAIAAARASLQEVKIQIHEMHVDVNADKQSATAQIVASAYINGASDPMVQELKMRLRKIEGRWKIGEVETVKTLGM